MFEELEPLGPITASLVVDSNGSAIGASGTSRGLGNATDLQLLIWLRQRAEVILTSGLTARLEDYKLPKSAKLAILTREGVPHLEMYRDQLLWLEGGMHNYHSAIDYLEASGHPNIHTEFGPTGFSQLVGSKRAVGVLSSPTSTGVETATELLDLKTVLNLELPDLHIAVVTGRG